MKLTPTIKTNIIYVIALLHIVLFTYAAVSKLLDFENFQVQLGQSPLLSVYAGWVAWSVPLIEITLALLLMNRRTQFLALIGSFLLMVMFTAYIFIILQFSEYIPCSCGGILEKMNWTEHLYFNLFFCCLSAFAIMLTEIEKYPFIKIAKINFKILLLAISSSVAVITVVLLFLKSEQLIHQENNFVRRYPPHLYNKKQQINLNYVGHYFAGSNHKSFYLGNYSAPLTVMEIDFDLKKMKQHKIKLDDYSLPYRAAQVRVLDTTFYLSDGTVPCLFKGMITTWNVNRIPIDNKRFSAFEPIDNTLAVIRSRKQSNNESTLGILKYTHDKNNIRWNNSLLQKQIDGVFDSDGILHYNPSVQKIIYSYFYRNQFIVANKNLELHYRGNTIDTTTKAKIKIANLSNGDRKIAAPPLVVNRLISTNDTFLFVNSDVRGKYESTTMWKQATAVDVYNLETKEYQYSFYVYNINNKKPNGMFATSEQVYFLFDQVLIAYKLDSSVRRK
jgi:uncharacterized membrane protein YphA (DoxX/SURF4 family)